MTGQGLAFGIAPTTLHTAVMDFTQFVGPDGLALDTDSLNQVLSFFGIETEDEVIKQVVCTIITASLVQAKLSYSVPYRT
jgi:hypothetical protein